MAAGTVIAVAFVVVDVEVCGVAVVGDVVAV